MTVHPQAMIRRRAFYHRYIEMTRQEELKIDSGQYRCPTCEVMFLAVRPKRHVKGKYYPRIVYHYCGTRGDYQQELEDSVPNTLEGLWEGVHDR